MSNDYATAGNIVEGLEKDVTLSSGEKYRIRKILLQDLIGDGVALINFIAESELAEEESEESAMRTIIDSGKLPDLMAFFRRILVPGVVSVNITTGPTDVEHNTVNVDDFLKSSFVAAMELGTKILEHSNFSAAAWGAQRGKSFQGS